MTGAGMEKQTMDQAHVVLQRRFKTAETPTYIAAENALYWVDIEGQTVNRLLLDSGAHASWPTPERACGVVPHANGGLVVGFPHALVAFDPQRKTFSELVAIERDQPHNRSNEMKCDPHGRIWLGTMREGLDQNPPADPFVAALYCYDGQTLTCALTGIAEANTLAWTDDGGMYFADTYRTTIWHFDVAGVTLTNRRVLFDADHPGVPDGSAIDSEGFLWNCRFGAGCVLRIAPDGRVDRMVRVPATNPTSCVFGAPDLGTLYITSESVGLSEQQLHDNPLEGSIFAVETGVRGTPTYAFQPAAHGVKRER
jgi:sugar lactone lactonase YvrE